MPGRRLKGKLIFIINFNVFNTCFRFRHSSNLLEMLRAQTADNMFSNSSNRMGPDFGVGFDIGGMSAVGLVNQLQQQSFPGSGIGAIGG